MDQFYQIVYKLASGGMLMAGRSADMDAMQGCVSVLSCRLVSARAPMHRCMTPITRRLRGAGAALSTLLVCLSAYASDGLDARLLTAAVPSATGTGSSGGTALNSADGRFVAFASNAWDLVPGAVDVNATSDVFLLDRSSGAVTLVSRAATATLASANGSSGPAAISDDGEWLLFESTSTNLVAGASDPLSFVSDVFLFQRSTGSVTLVSRAIGPQLRAANGQSFPVGMSADGRWIVFNSQATDLIEGVTDGNGQADTFLYQRDTGAVTLLSRTASSPLVAASQGGHAVSISADGGWVLMTSRSTNLLNGLVLLGGHEGIFLYERSTGSVRLASRSAASPLVGTDDYAYPRAMSADGELVLFGSHASNLLPGTPLQLGRVQTFLYRRSSDSVQLVSRSAASPSAPGNGASGPAGMSADGRWIVLNSVATDLVNGVTDTNGATDAFLFDSATGSMSLLSRVAAAPQTAASGFAATISANGESIILESHVDTLIDGVEDTNATTDVFMHHRSTGATSLVSRAAGSPPATANGQSSIYTSYLNPIPSCTSYCISADGDWVLFLTDGTNLAPGVQDSNRSRDLYQYKRSTDSASLISRAASVLRAGNEGTVVPTVISADGSTIMFESAAINLLEGVSDNERYSDTFVFDRTTGITSLVSRSSSAQGRVANRDTRPVAITSDGEWALLKSIASDLVAGVSDTNGEWDVVLFQRSSGSMTLVSRSAGSATVSANGRSEPIAISDDGEWILFQSHATDLVSGLIDANASGADVYLYQRSSGGVTLVSRAANSGSTTGNDNSIPRAISQDGRWVVFESWATDLVSGISDANNRLSDVFLFDRTSGETTLVSRSSTSPNSTANLATVVAALSPDGEWIVLESPSSDLVNGVATSLTRSDVYLYRRSTGAIQLVSRAYTGASDANGESRARAVSADGEWVLFDSHASDLTAGAIDTNGTSDVFAFRRTTGEVSLLSRTAASAVTAAGASTAAGMSADGEWILIASRAANLIPDFINPQSVGGIYLLERRTGRMRLASRSSGSPSTNANGHLLVDAISANGEVFALSGEATDLVAGVIDNNRRPDAYLVRNRGVGLIFDSGFEPAQKQ